MREKEERKESEKKVKWDKRWKREGLGIEERDKNEMNDT